MDLHIGKVLGFRYIDYYRSILTYEKFRYHTETEAQSIRARYPNVDFDWYPMTKFGQVYTPPSYSDPYANYIARMLDRYAKA